MTTRLDVVREAAEHIGTRWQHQATLKGVACDCRGLVVSVACKLKLPYSDEAARDPALRNYGRDPNPKVLIASCEKYMDRVLPKTAMRLGDVLVMSYETDEPRHFAVLSRRAPDYIIHAYAQRREVVENILDARWRNRIVAVFSYRGVL